MFRLSKLGLALVVVLGSMGMASAAGLSHHHHHNHGYHHHHRSVWSYRGGRWVYVQLAGPVYQVYYRANPRTPWTLYADYATPGDAQLDMATLRGQGYEVFMQ